MIKLRNLQIAQYQVAEQSVCLIKHRLMMPVSV